MKKPAAVLYGIVLVFLCTVSAHADTVYLAGVTATSGWVDVNKTGTGDSNLCWAASASDVLAFTGWDGSLSTVSQIFSAFISNWTNSGGSAYYGIE